MFVPTHTYFPASVFRAFVIISFPPRIWGNRRGGGGERLNTERKNNIGVWETLGGCGWHSENRKQHGSTITKHFLIAFRNACEHALTVPKKPLQHHDEMFSQAHNGSVLESVFYWGVFLHLSPSHFLLFPLSFHLKSKSLSVCLFLLRVSWAKEHFPNPTQPQVPEGTPEALQDCEHFSSRHKELQDSFNHYCRACFKE